MGGGALGTVKKKEAQGLRIYLQRLEEVEGGGRYYEGAIYMR